MKTYWLLCIGLLLTFKTYGMPCVDVSEIHLKLKAHTSNIVNAATPRAGRTDVVCVGKHCKLKKSTESKVVYEPGHPAANKRGYVVYPDINIKSEFEKLSQAADELKDLASRGLCHTQIVQATEGVIVQYEKGTILSDVFRYSKNNELISWARTYSSGKREIFDFKSRLNDKKHLTSSFVF